MTVEVGFDGVFKDSGIHLSRLRRGDYLRWVVRFS